MRIPAMMIRERVVLFWCSMALVLSGISEADVTVSMEGEGRNGARASKERRRLGSGGR